MTAVTTLERPNARRDWKQVGAGFAYSAAWGAGLTVFSASTTVSSSGRQLLADYWGHSVPLTGQFVLTEGLAAVFLAMVLLPASASLTPRLWPVGVIATLTAATVSVLQCALGVVMATVAVPGRHVGALGGLGDALNRLDGVKMSLLAVTFVCLALGRTGTSKGAGALTALYLLTAGALAGSAYGYLVLDDTMAMVAYASLPLLMASVTVTGLLVPRRTSP